MDGASHSSEPARLLAQARGGSERALGRLCSALEHERIDLSSLGIDELVEPTAQVIGVTGAPGVGKSMLVSALIGAYRRRDRRVAVLAIDPSSPRSGGSLLGDRVRMGLHGLDPGVFVRSVADRGHPGAVSHVAGNEIALFDACGFDVVIVETVGAGQSDLGVEAIVKLVVVVLAPGLGDDIQVAKAGILEIADVFVVNKADLPEAQQVVAELTAMTRLIATGKGVDRPSVMPTSALHGSGIDELCDELDRRSKMAGESSEHERRKERAKSLLSEGALELVRRWLASPPGQEALLRHGEQLEKASGDRSAHLIELLRELVQGSE